MPIDKKLYQSVVPLKGDATKVYSKNSIRQAINENDYFVVDGKIVLKSSLNLNKGTLKEIPSDYVNKANKKDAVLEKIGWQNKAGKPAILQGLARTVGASAAMAAGAAYSTPAVGTLKALAKNVVAGGVGAEGFAMLEGRTATPTELAIGTGMEMGIPMVMKGVENIPSQITKHITGTSSELSTLQNVDYSIQKGISKIKSGLNENVIDPIKSKIALHKELMNTNRGKIYNYDVSSNKTYQSYREQINSNFRNKLLEKKYENNLSVPMYKGQLEYKTREYIKNKNIDSDSRIHVPVNKSKIKLSNEIYRNVLADKVSSEQKRYFGYQQYDGQPFNFRTRYNNLQELEDAVNSGTFKPDDNSRLEVAKLIEDELKRYPNAKVSGSSVLFRDGKINTYPQDVDLYVEDLAKRSEKHLNIGNNRQATNITIPQIQKQITAYNNPEEYLLANKKAVEDVVINNKEIQPDSFYKPKGLKDFNPNENSVMDAFMSNKPKHIERTHEMFGTLSETELENVIVKHRTLLGHKDLSIPKFDFDNVGDNINFLKESGFSGDVNSLANNPKKMQLYFDNLYANKVLNSRQITKYENNTNNLFEYFNNNKGPGGRAYGDGIYYQKSGYENYGPLEAISEFKLKRPIENPSDILRSNAQLFEGVDSGTNNVLPQKQSSSILNSTYFYNDGTQMRFVPKAQKTIDDIPTGINSSNTSQTNSGKRINLPITKQHTKIGKQPVVTKGYDKWIDKRLKEKLIGDYDKESVSKYYKLKKGNETGYFNLKDTKLEILRSKKLDELSEKRRGIISEVDDYRIKIKKAKDIAKITPVGAGLAIGGTQAVSAIKNNDKKTDLRIFVTNPELFAKTDSADLSEFKNDIIKLRKEYVSKKEKYNSTLKTARKNYDISTFDMIFRRGEKLGGNLSENIDNYYNNLDEEKRKRLVKLIDSIK